MPDIKIRHTLGHRAIFSCFKACENLFDHGRFSRLYVFWQSQNSWSEHLLSFPSSTWVTMAKNSQLDNIKNSQLLESATNIYAPLGYLYLYLKNKRITWGWPCLLPSKKDTWLRRYANSGCSGSFRCVQLQWTALGNPPVYNQLSATSKI